MRIRYFSGGVDIDIDTKRLDGNLKEAQKLLNLQVAADCEPLVPFRQGGLRGSVRYPNGIYGGVLEYDSPYAHYQYTGVVYGPNLPQYDEAGNLVGWRSPPKKYPTQRKLQYHHRGTGGAWFETAKRLHKKRWLRLVQRTAGGR
ncbi:MAG: minor capsid protein [Clostridiales bacterium]|nr:minor capsid protein [Clostridiales bacterium]